MVTSALVINAYLICSMVLSLAGHSGIALHFGASWQTDAFFIAHDISGLVSKILLSHQVAAVLIPIFVEQQAYGAEAALTAFGRAYATLALGALALGATLWFAAPLVAGMYTPGFKPPAQELTQHLLRVLLPGSFLILLSTIATSVLHAKHRFGLPAMAAILPSAGLVLGALTPSGALGVFGPAAGLLLGSIGQFLVIHGGLQRQGLRTRHLRVSWQDPVVRRVCWLASPFFVTYGLGQVTGLIQKILASHLQPGSFSAMIYAHRLYSGLVNLTLNTYHTVLYPRLVHEAVEGDRASMVRMLSRALRHLAFIVLPVMSILALAREDIIAILFGRGAFDQVAIQTTSDLFLLYLTAMVPVGVYTLFYRALFSLGRSWDIVAVSAAGEVVQAGLYLVVTPLLGVRGLVLASALTAGFVAMAFRVVLSRQVPDAKRRLVATLPLARILGLAILAAWVGSTLAQAVIPGGDFLARGLRIVMTSGASLGTYVVVASIMHLDELSDVRRATGALALWWRRRSSKTLGEQ